MAAFFTSLLPQFGTTDAGPSFWLMLGLGLLFCLLTWLWLVLYATAIQRPWPRAARLGAAARHRGGDRNGAGRARAAGGDRAASALVRSTHSYTFRTPCVYATCMSKERTNIEIDSGHVEAIMDRYGVRTKTAAVDLALRHLAGQPMTREEALGMRGARAIGAPPPDVPPRATA